MQFSKYNIAVEILQQARKHPQYRHIASLYLRTLQLKSPNETLGHEYDAQTLIIDLEDNKTNQMTSTVPLTINKINTNRDGNNRNTNRKRFQFRRNVQCDCCRGFGHNIDEDVCRIGAQVYHAMQFTKDHLEKAQQNATVYNMANTVSNRTQVKSTKVIPLADDDSDDMEDDITTHLEKIGHSMVYSFTNPKQMERNYIKSIDNPESE